jgi:hypothetical protein
VPSVHHHIRVLLIAALCGCARGGETSDTASGPRLCLRESPTIPFVVGDTATLQVGPVDASDSLCLPDAGGARWTSSDPAVARVSERGFLTAVQPGRTTVTATRGESRDSATFLVVAPIRDVRIVPDSLTMDIGDSASFHIVTTGTVSIPVWWYSAGPVIGFARPGAREPAPVSVTADRVTVWAREPGEALLVAGTRYLRDAAHVRVVVR